MERKSSATARRWERFGGAADAFARARSVRERSFSKRAAGATTPRNRFQAYPFPPRARDRRRPSAHSQPIATAPNARARGIARAARMSIRVRAPHGNARRLIPTPIRAYKPGAGIRTGRNRRGLPGPRSPPSKLGGAGTGERVPGSVLDHLDALPAVLRLPRPDLHEEGHLDAAARNDGHADGQPLNLLGHGRREAFDARDDRLQVVRVRDLEDHLGVALRQDVLVDLRRALRDDHEAEAELAAFRGEGSEDLRGGDLAHLGAEVVGLLDDDHEGRDLPDLTQLEHRRREAVHDELLDVRGDALQVDDRRLPLDDELVDSGALLGEDLDLAKVLEVVDEGRVLGVLLPLEDAHDVPDRVRLRRLAQEVEGLPEGREVGADLRGSREGEDGPRTRGV